ncbi:MAG: peptide transporter [Planctomycetota bacterium]
MSTLRYDKELEQYRNLMLPPDTFEEGFRWSSLIGALFIALLMVPGAMYMQLVAGFGVGPAARWVTVILFIEVARRAHKHLSRPELFILFYMAGAVLATPFAGLFWRQFYIQSNAAYGAGVAQEIPSWWAPNDPAVLDQRTFLHTAWITPLALVVFGMFTSRLNNTILGYGLFRVASDIEKLPFPMATIGAQGVMALAEQSEEEKESGEGSWRWRVFSVGGILGLAFGVIYMGLPTISGAILKKPIMILPIPWSDFTKQTQDYLPAVAVGINWNLSHLVTGMVLPFFAMLGSFVALIMTMIANPILYRYGILSTWEQNDDTIPTLYKNNIDFYFSFTIGTGVAIATAGVVQVIRAVQRRRKAVKAGEEIEDVSQGVRDKTNRGDIPTSIVLGTYVLTTTAYIVVSGFLIDWDPTVMLILVVFGFAYTPLLSYVTARLEGMAGQVVTIPFVREAAFILSGYKGVAVWFLPVPLANYGRRTVMYRQAELTGTRFWSLWKAELVLVPIVLIATIFFANFIWSLAPIPSARYPYTEKIWELNAAMQSIIHSSTLGRHSPFEEAFKPRVMLAGGLVGGVLFTVTWMLKMPVLFVFGILRGLSNTLPHVVVPQFIGALLSRFYFERRMGLKWRQYVPVVAAGFSCGMGLITMLCVGVTFLAKAVIQLPY